MHLKSAIIGLAAIIASTTALETDMVRGPKIPFSKVAPEDNSKLLLLPTGPHRFYPPVFPPNVRPYRPTFPKRADEELEVEAVDASKVILPYPRPYPPIYRPYRPKRDDDDDDDAADVEDASKIIIIPGRYPPYPRPYPPVYPPIYPGYPPIIILGRKKGGRPGVRPRADVDVMAKIETHKDKDHDEDDDHDDHDDEDSKPSKIYPPPRRPPWWFRHPHILT
ncbi:hypothetical protein BGX33_002801, partial [Mortierella sp. NVP41]